REIERDEIGAINHYLNELRLDVRRAELRYGPDSPEVREAKAEAEARAAELQVEYRALAETASAIKAEDAQYRITLAAVDGQTKEMQLSQIVRFYAANDLSYFEKWGVYLSRWGEFL